MVVSVIKFIFLPLLLNFQVSFISFLMWYLTVWPPFLLLQLLLFSNRLSSQRNVHICINRSTVVDCLMTSIFNACDTSALLKISLSSVVSDGYFPLMVLSTSCCFSVHYQHFPFNGGLFRSQYTLECFKPFNLFIRFQFKKKGIWV